MLGSGKIPDEVGHLILNEEGAVVESSGELQNNEIVGSVIVNILQLSKSQLYPSDGTESFRKISITYCDHSYVICRSNKKIIIIKRRSAGHEPVKV